MSRLTTYLEPTVQDQVPSPEREQSAGQRGKQGLAEAFAGLAGHRSGRPLRRNNARDQRLRVTPVRRQQVPS
jgi:hypothetical protein